MGFEKEPSQILFSSYLKPALPVGEYKVTITQKLSKVQGTGTEKLLQKETYKNFFVAGERFRINPGEIGGVFPPAFSLGEHSGVFPHVMIKRSTLPWERKISPNDNSSFCPWLGLLVIYENEEAFVTSSPAKLADVRSRLKIEDSAEPGEADTDTIQILRIKKELLHNILPAKTDLCALTHVRQVVGNTNKADAGNMAVLIANRLPLKGGVSTVYLVSFENRYKDGDSGAFDDTEKDEWVSLVQLHSWSFTSTEHFKISQTFLNKAGNLTPTIKEKLNKISGKEFFTEKDFLKSLKEEAQLTEEELNTYQPELIKDFSFGDFSNLVKHLSRTPSTLRLPDSKLPSTDQNLKYLQSGFYPLPHKLRQGAQTVSWYHGPLATAPAKPLPIGSVACADSLLHYYQDNGMFDVSYAAAWELGRLLALQNAHFSAALYKWKKQYVRSLHKARQMRAVPHLPGANRDYAPAPLPVSADHWLKDLALLKGVPFNYLVPDEELLPVESIRFFRLDKSWVQTLLDGALSIGRIARNDAEYDSMIIAEEKLLACKEVTGFIMRSEVVSGWPALQIEGFGSVKEDDKLNILRNESLSANVKLCLFEGELKALSLHLKPEMLHFGLDWSEEKGFSKKWRNENGEEDKDIVTTVSVNSLRIMDVKSFMNGSVKITSSAQMAVQLLEGVQCVRFEI